jgi:hypothetical protein
MSEQNHNLHTDTDYYRSDPLPEVLSQVTSFIPQLQRQVIYLNYSNHLFLMKC